MDGLFSFYHTISSLFCSHWVMQWFWRVCHEHSLLQLNPLITRIQYHEASPEFLKLSLRQDWTLLQPVSEYRPNGSEWKQWWQNKKRFEWFLTTVNKLGSWERVNCNSSFFFKSVYTLNDITAYVYLQYMYTSRQGVHLLEVLIPWLMQDNIIMLTFRLWNNRWLKEQHEPRAKNSNPGELEIHSALPPIINKTTCLGIIFTFMRIWGQFITTEFVWFSETPGSMEKYSHLDWAVITTLQMLNFM